MAAKGKKKQRTNKKGKKKQTSSSNGEYDLEAMEKMMQSWQEEEQEQTKSDKSDKDQVDSADEDYMDNDDDTNDDESMVEENDEETAIQEEDSDEAGGEEEEGMSVEEEESDSEMEVEKTTEEPLDAEDDTLEEGEEKCTLDLRNLLATNPHQVNQRSLYQQQKSMSDEELPTILVSGAKMANDEYLLQKASEGCSQLLSGLWKLETEKSDAGPMAILPKYCDIVTPRELPPPKPKTETRWEKFAKERGIAPKEKRSRKVWDEATQSWGYRTGYQKASSENDPSSWPIMEVKKNDNPFEDPWQRARDAKKDRVDKNTMNRMRNAEKEGQLERGTTRRIMKGKKQAREEGREGGRKDVNNVTPAGVPLDLVEGKQRGKKLTKMALLASQRSTASMGKFDKMREGEPERRKSMSGLKKRKFESSTDNSVVKNEAKKSLKVLENVISGGGRSKERAIRRGHFAKGETGHDYDFNDGLGASTFRKKKGRAGIGKMSKITKKMAK